MQKRFERLAALLPEIPEMENFAVTGKCVLALDRHYKNTGAVLAGVASRDMLPEGLKGEIYSSQDGFLLAAPLNHDTAEVLRRVLAYCSAHVPAEPVTAAVSSPGEYRAGGMFNIVPERDSDIDAAADCMAFLALEHNSESGFSLLAESDINASSLSPLPSGHIFTDGSASVCQKREQEDYAERRFIISDRKSVYFSSDVLQECTELYGHMPAKLGFFERQLKNVRKDDFELIVRMKNDPEKLTAHILYLTRELRRAGTAHCRLLLPEPVKPEWLSALCFGNCGALTLGGGLRRDYT